MLSLILDSRYGRGVLGLVLVWGAVFALAPFTETSGTYLELAIAVILTLAYLGYESEWAKGGEVLPLPSDEYRIDLSRGPLGLHVGRLSYLGERESAEGVQHLSTVRGVRQRKVWNVLADVAWGEDQDERIKVRKDAQAAQDTGISGVAA